MTTYTPKFIKRWTLPPSYFGATWEGFYSSGFGRSRDSDCLERSNFEVAWKALQGVSDNVQIVSENHWAVGWVEWIAIPEDDYKALKAADEMCAAVESYSVLDEDDHSEKEQAVADETWANCYSVKERIAYIRRASQYEFEFHSLADMLGCVRGKYFAGYASELIS